MRILLVEDDKIVARGITLALKAAAMIVDTSDTGEEALVTSPHRVVREEF